jgi:hypothetical protein
MFILLRPGTEGLLGANRALIAERAVAVFGLCRTSTFCFISS